VAGLVRQLSMFIIKARKTKFPAGLFEYLLSVLYFVAESLFDPLAYKPV
jgi:hypothetical protein